MESFEGTVSGAAGGFNFIHVASTGGDDAYSQFVMIVPSSGTGELAGIAGRGEVIVMGGDAHTVNLDYTLG